MLIEDALKEFLDEDIGHGDITTDALVDLAVKATGTVVCKERAVVAGLSESLILLKLLGCEGKPKVRDGHNHSRSKWFWKRSPESGTCIVELALSHVRSSNGDG